MGKKFSSATNTSDKVVFDADSVEEVEVAEVETAPEEEIQENTPEISMEIDESPNKADRLVAIKLSRAYSCSIGGTRYNFEPNKRYNVVADVKSILMREPNLLLPL